MATHSKALEAFLSTVVEEDLSDVYLLCPELDEAEAVVKDYSFFEGTTKSEDGESEEPWFSLNLNFSIDSQEAREVTKRDEVFAPASYFLKLNSTGGLDINGNERLAKMLKILGVGTKGKTAFEILEDTKGRSALVKVRHQVRKKNKEDVLDEEGNPVLDARITAAARM